MNDLRPVNGRYGNIGADSVFADSRGTAENLKWLFGPKESARARRLLLLLLFPALVLAGTLAFDFVFDDNLVILEDSLVTGQLNLGEIFASQIRVIDVALGYYRPIITLLYRADRALWGSNPAGYHLTNLLWHLLATVLVYWVTLRSTGRIVTAWAAGMLFSVLPAHTEAIGWIQGRVDLVSSTLLLLALLALFRSQGSVGPTCWHWSALAGLIFLGALLAKESVVALPLAWTVWEISAIRRGDSNRRGAGVVSRFLSLFLAGLVYWTLRVRAVGALVSFPLSLSAIGLRALALLSVLGEYGRILLFPDLTLNFYSGIRVAATPTVLAISLVVALVVGSALAAAWRWAPEFLPWVAWVPIMLSPPLLFILYEPAPEVGFYTAERFLYLPSVGWCVLLGSLVARFLEAQAKARRSRLGLMTFGAVLAGYAGLTLLRLLPWADPVDLYLAMKAQPNLSAAVRILAHNNLGRVYLERGDFTPARTEFQAALRLNPDSAFAYNNMGVLLIREGNPIEARQWLEKAIHLDPTYGDSFGNLGAAYEATGDLPAARRAYEAGVRAAPNSTWLAKGLARVSAEDAFHRGLKVGVSR